MSQEKPQRSTQEIQQEYQNLAFRAGNLQYEIAEKTKDLSLINSSMRDCNFEFVAAQKVEAAVAEAASKAKDAAKAEAKAEQQAAQEEAKAEQQAAQEEANKPEAGEAK